MVKLKELDASALVPGDLVALEMGEQISADVQLLEKNIFSCPEAALSGESIPAEK
jgi:Ca2+-transporting ATPase